jgi:hypothetical protein
MPDRNADPSKELLTRARRIETRLTTLMIHMGVETLSAKPEFLPAVEAYDSLAGELARVSLPSRDCSLKSILGCIPAGFSGDVRVMIGADHVTTLAVSDRT